jgi:hypothetical protein
MIASMLREIPSGFEKDKLKLNLQQQIIDFKHHNTQHTYDIENSYLQLDY